MKTCVVGIEPWPAAWFGFALTREKPRNIPAGYWAIARTSFGWRIELAGQKAPQNWEALAQVLTGGGGASAEIAETHDVRSGARRWLFARQGRPAGLLFIAREPVAASRAFLCTEFEKAEACNARALLAGRPATGVAEAGRTVCVCHGVGAKEIEAAITLHGAADPEAVGRLTNAGTGCGSCRSEIRRILKDEASRPPASQQINVLEPAE